MGVWRGSHENPKPLRLQLFIEAKYSEDFLRDKYMCKGLSKSIVIIEIYKVLKEKWVIEMFFRDPKG